MRNKVDILLISETIIDITFPSSQFQIPGYSNPYRLDRRQHGGGLLLYIRSDIPSRHVKYLTILNFFVEINLYKKKWLIGCSYNPS